MNQKGAVIVIVAGLMVAFIGMAALGLDLGHLYLVRNELQNAADSGALAGARFLYLEDGSAVNPGANDRANEAATSNIADKVMVDINLGDIQRGHWSFGLGTLPRGFYPNDSLVRVNLARSLVELDQDPSFINAMQVRTRRDATKAASFFATILGYTGFKLATEAVAYIGFAADAGPAEVDEPIAICKQAITDADGAFSCVTGRMFNSGSNLETHNTSAWTNFDQPCEGAASGNEVRRIITNDQGNTYTIGLGGMSSTGGNDTGPALFSLMNKWVQVTNKTVVWPMTLPVIDCPGNNTTSCADVVGFVRIKVVWINGNNPTWDSVPTTMSDPEGEYPPWSSGLPSDNSTVQTVTLPDGFIYQTTPRWDSFVQHFNLKDAGGHPAQFKPTSAGKTIYFVPSCVYQDIIGNSGGDPFGILARIPRLVN